MRAMSLLQEQLRILLLRRLVWLKGGLSERKERVKGGTGTGGQGRMQSSLNKEESGVDLLSSTLSRLSAASLVSSPDFVWSSFPPSVPPLSTSLSTIPTLSTPHTPSLHIKLALCINLVRVS